MTRLIEVALKIIILVLSIFRSTIPSGVRSFTAQFDLVQLPQGTLPATVF